MAMRFDRFTEKAQEALIAAQNAAKQNSRPHVEAEDLLLALLGQPEGIPAAVLSRIGVNAGALRSQVEQALAREPKVYGQGDLSVGPGLRGALETAQGEAERLKDEYISTEHLFLAILGEQRTAVAKLMKPSTREWFADARNYALYANDGGQYDELVKYMKLR